MDNKKQNDLSLQYLLDKIFSTLDDLIERIDLVDEAKGEDILRLHKEIEEAKAIAAKLAPYHDIVITLGKNLSPEGLKELVNDVIELKKFMSAHNARIQERALIWATLLKFVVPGTIFILGMIWWIIKTYFFK